MSASNSITMVGNLVADPILRYTSTGKAVTNARVAVNDRINVGGQWQDKTTFINVVVWGQQAENFAGSVGKGTRVQFTGRLETREYTPEGGNPATDRQFFTEVNVQEIAVSCKFAMVNAVAINAETPAPAAV